MAAWCGNPKAARITALTATRSEEKNASREVSTVVSCRITSMVRFLGILLFRAIQSRAGHHRSPNWILDALFSGERQAPLVTVLDGGGHSLAFLAELSRTPARHLGVTRFGQSGDLAKVERHHRSDVDSIVQAALDLQP